MTTGTVKLADVIVPDVFAQYMINDTTRLARVFQSGLVVHDAAMAGLLSGGGRIFQHPVWGDLSNDSAVLGSDDPTVSITPQKIGTFKHQFVRQWRNQAWQAALLAGELAGSDPMTRISARVGAYWAREFDRATIATLSGLLADNVANDSGDMVYDATGNTGTTTIGTQTVQNYSMSANVILEARQTMGDTAEDLKILVMHSRLYTNLLKQNLITFQKNSDGTTDLPYYLGYAVVVSDQCPTATVTGSPNYTKYTSYLCAPGVIGFSESPPKKPVAIYDEPLKANGTGIESLITRRQFALHPYGFSWTDASIAAEFPTDAELATAGNWDRKFPERKQVKIAAIYTRDG